MQLTYKTENPEVIQTVTQAVNDSASVSEDGYISIDVLANDIDLSGIKKPAVSVSNPAYGTASINEDGTVKYTPLPDFYGPDSFTYTNSDGNTATVNMVVNSVEDLSIMVKDEVSTDEDVAITIAVLNNDTDADGTPSPVESVSTPLQGTANVNPDYTVTYTPNPGFSGLDEFSYTNEDGNTEYVFVTVNPVDDPTLTVVDHITTDEDVAITFNPLDNDTDEDSDISPIASFTQPSNGVIVKNADNTLTYTPDEDYNGSDLFRYTNEDGQTSDVFITINPMDELTIAVDDLVTVTQNVLKTISILANDTDKDGYLEEAETLTQPLHGTAVINMYGSVDYTPDTDYLGPDSFTYTNYDGNSATVTIDVVKDPYGPMEITSDMLFDKDCNPLVGYNPDTITHYNAIGIYYEHNDYPTVDKDLLALINWDSTEGIVTVDVYKYQLDINKWVITDQVHINSTWLSDTPVHLLPYSTKVSISDDNLVISSKQYADNDGSSVISTVWLFKPNSIPQYHEVDSLDIEGIEVIRTVINGTDLIVLCSDKYHVDMDGWGYYAIDTYFLKIYDISSDTLQHKQDIVIDVDELSTRIPGSSYRSTIISEDLKCTENLVSVPVTLIATDDLGKHTTHHIYTFALQSNGLYVETPRISLRAPYTGSVGIVNNFCISDDKIYTLTGTFIGDSVPGSNSTRTGYDYSVPSAPIPVLDDDGIVLYHSEFFGLQVHNLVNGSWEATHIPLASLVSPYGYPYSMEARDDVLYICISGGFSYKIEGTYNTWNTVYPVNIEMYNIKSGSAEFMNACDDIFDWTLYDTSYTSANNYSGHFPSDPNRGISKSSIHFCQESILSYTPTSLAPAVCNYTLTRD